MFSGGNPFTTFTVSRLTVMTWAMRRTMYCGSSGRLGSLVMPLRLSVLTWYWSMTQSRAERLPRRYVKGLGRDAFEGEEVVIDQRGLVASELHLLHAPVELGVGVLAAREGVFLGLFVADVEAGELLAGGGEGVEYLCVLGRRSAAVRNRSRLERDRGCEFAWRAPACRAAAGRETRARAPARALTWRGESPRQAEVSPACDRRLLRRGDTGWRAAGGELPVRNKASS